LLHDGLVKIDFIVSQMKNTRLISRIGLVVLIALAITVLMGMSRISVMIRIEALGLYEFGRLDYFIRIVALFLVCAVFLSANFFYNNVNLGPLKFNLLSIKGIILFNFLIFIPVQIAYVLLIVSQVDLPVSDRVPVEEGGSEFIFLTMVTNMALMLVSALVGTVYRFMGENYRIKLKNQILQKESTEARYANLKEQLNPHFLFNSFSTLNGLIDESRSKAKKYVHDMCDVYRYVLKNDNVETVTLREELEYAKIYLSMVKERFGDSVHDEINISKETLEMKLPPLAIQMLIENAVKHNSFNNDHPLRLTIQSSNSFIEVENSLRERLINDSHSLGLYNLNLRYKYLCDGEVIIKKTETTFNVKIPLLP